MKRAFLNEKFHKFARGEYTWIRNCLSRHKKLSLQIWRKSEILNIRQNKIHTFSNQYKNRKVDVKNDPISRPDDGGLKPFLFLSGAYQAEQNMYLLL